MLINILWNLFDVMWVGNFLNDFIESKVSFTCI